MVQDELAAARDAFLAVIDDVSDAEWGRRVSPDAWSIAEIAEHVTLVSRDVGRLVRGALLRTPPSEEPSSGMEERIRRRLPDRSTRIQAPERVLPVGTWSTRAELRAAYLGSRDELLDWLRTTDAPLRAHRFVHPRLGPMDGIEWLVFLAAHDRRHVAQIEETRRSGA